MQQTDKWKVTEMVSAASSVLWLEAILCCVARFTPLPNLNGQISRHFAISGYRVGELIACEACITCVRSLGEPHCAVLYAV